MTCPYANSPFVAAAPAARRHDAWMNAWSRPIVGLGFGEALARRRDR